MPVKIGVNPQLRSFQKPLHSNEEEGNESPIASLIDRIEQSKTSKLGCFDGEMID